MRKIFCGVSFLAGMMCFGAAMALPPADVSAAPHRHVRFEAQVAATHVAAQPSREFVCPDAKDKTAISCFLNATEHLYEVCANVKGIELSEFGYAHGEEGSNGFKSDFCRQKQRASLPRYFNEAMREAEKNYSCEVIIDLAELYRSWGDWMSAIKPYPGESEASYQARAGAPEEIFQAYDSEIRAAMARVKADKKLHKTVRGCYITRSGMERRS
jgi:hypothetical protein